MALKRKRHDTPDAVEQEFENLDQSKEGMFVWMANRAPTASDKGSKVWIYKNGTTLAMYLLDSTAGAWRGPVNFTP